MRDILHERIRKFLLNHPKVQVILSYEPEFREMAYEEMDDKLEEENGDPYIGSIDEAADERLRDMAYGLRQSAKYHVLCAILDPYGDDLDLFTATGVRKIYTYSIFTEDELTIVDLDVQGEFTELTVTGDFKQLLVDHNLIKRPYRYSREEGWLWVYTCGKGSDDEGYLWFRDLPSSQTKQLKK